MNINFKALTVGCGVVAVSAAALLLPQGDAATAAQPANVTQGMVAVIDKDSGELRAPTNEEASRYQAPAKSKDSEPTVERRADGSESMKLDDSYTIFSTVQRNSDGGWTRQCSLNHDHAQHVNKAVK